MNKKLTLLLLLAMWLYGYSAQATCSYTPTNVKVKTTTVPGKGILASWDPDMANLGVTKYIVIMELTNVTPHRIDTIQAGFQSSIYIPYSQLCNGEYDITIVAICADGTNGPVSQIAQISVISEEACYLSTTLCPGISIDATKKDDGGLKLIEIPCTQNTFTIKPIIKVINSTILGYSVKKIPFSPPYPFTEGDTVSLKQDDAFSEVTYLPFKFCFYENSYDKLLMGPNGFLSFNTENANKACGWELTSYTNNLPLSNFGGSNNWKNAIYGVLEDIDPGREIDGKRGTFRWAIRGQAPCRVFVNSYYEVPVFFKQSNARESYQIVLYEGTNIIDVYVLKRNYVPGWNKGRGVIGVQNIDGTKATCAPGRNILDNWSTFDSVTGINKPEAWRFTPITQDVAGSYSITWANLHGQKYGTGDSLTVDCKTFVRDYIVSTLELEEACSGRKAVYKDTVNLQFLKPEVKKNDTLCQMEPYNINGWNIPKQKVTGNFEFFRNKTGNVNDFCGCDTIFSLKLKINERPNRDTSTIACGGDTVWLNNKFTTKNTYLLDTLKSKTGCDSIIILRVNRYPLATAALQNIPQICANDGQFTLDFAKKITGNDLEPSIYKINFDEKAKAAGFQDQEGNFDTATYKINVIMPAKVYPDSYCAEIFFSDTVYKCKGTTFQQCFDILYPDTIMQQKWNDVIAVKNKFYNGGFDISAVQWYQDIDGITTLLGGQNNTILQNISQGSSYRVEVTRPDGSKQMSCPLQIGAGKPQKPLIILGDRISIKVFKGTSIVNLWTIDGILLQNIYQTQPSYQIDAPTREGTYILEVISNEGGRAVTPLVINRR